MEEFPIEVGREYTFLSKTAGAPSVDRVVEISPHGEVRTEEVMYANQRRVGYFPTHLWCSLHRFRETHVPYEPPNVEKLQARVEELEAENARWIKRNKQLEDKLATIRQLVR